MIITCSKIYDETEVKLHWPGSWILMPL